MIGDRIRAFGGIEEGRVHRSRADRRHRDAAIAELFRGGAGEVFDRRLGAGIGGIERREGAEQRRDQRETLPLSLTFLPASFRKKKADLELTAVILSYSASVMSTIGFFNTLPTVLIAISMPPSAALASAKSFSIAPAPVRSA